MLKKFRIALIEACKDMGLTDKAIDDLMAIGAKALKDDASDEDIQSAVDSLVPFAKAMQGEITRKTSGKKNPAKPSGKQSASEGEDEDEDGNETPDWFKKEMKSYKDELDALKSENETLKKEKSAETRASLISNKAKELGIPEYLMKRVSLAEDADINTELENFKQELVTNGLMPKQAFDQGTLTAQMKADAESWAKGLPDK